MLETQLHESFKDSANGNAHDENTSKQVQVLNALNAQQKLKIEQLESMLEQEKQQLNEAELKKRETEAVQLELKQKQEEQERTHKLASEQ